MELIEVDQNFYKEIIPNPYHIFANADFNGLNKNKCEELHFLLFKNSKYKLGLIGGSVASTFLSPFSSPFGGFTFIHQDIKIKDIEEALILLEFWAKSKKIKKISFTLPPSLYQKKFLAKQINSLYRYEYKISNIDLNYHFETKNFNEYTTNHLWYAAKKALKNAVSNSLCLTQCTEQNDKQLAYNIIKENRSSRGFPLRMSFEDISITDSLIKKDFFILHTKDQIPIASSIVYYISDEIVQVVYWGNISEYSELKPMNFLSYKLFEYYSNINIRYIDIGPSTENSIPNYGLCEFKESIGCDILPKYTFVKTL